MRLKNNSSAFVLVAGIVLGLFLAILLQSAFMRVQIQLQESSSLLASQQAFYAAEAGISQALYELRRNPSWDPSAVFPAVGDVPVRGDDADAATTRGFYTVDVAPAPDYQGFPSVWVRSDGKDLDKRITRTIKTRVIVENPASFFISTAGNLLIGSGAVLNHDILGRDVTFEVNNALSDDAKKITVNGKALYLNTISGEKDPAVTITGGAEKFSSVTFAGVDTARYRDLAKAGGKYVSGDFSYTGDIDLASLPEAANGLIFAEGDVRISGTVKDSMLIVAGGNIYIDDDLTAPPTGSVTPQLGLLAGRDVVIPASAPSDMTVEAFIMADGAAGSKGGIFIAEGTKATKGAFNFTGAMALRGGQDPSGVDARTAADLNVYRNRIYTYNSDLQDKRTIPFLPFIANIVNWQEINPNDVFP